MRDVHLLNELKAEPGWASRMQRFSSELSSLH
jgi:hypothetical protein